MKLHIAIELFSVIVELNSVFLRPKSGHYDLCCKALCQRYQKDMHLRVMHLKIYV